MVYRTEGRNHRRQDVKERRQKGFAVYMLLGLLIAGVVGLSFSGLLTVSAVKASMAVKDDLTRFRYTVLENLSRPSIAPVRGEEFYSWESMIWMSDVLPAAALVFGRPSSTLGIEGDAYMAHRNTSRLMDSMFIRMLDSGVKYNGRALGKMFNAFWGDHGAVIVPSVDDQFSIQFVSSQMFAFPEGVNDARSFWNDNAPALVSPSSPVSFMDIVW